MRITLALKRQKQKPHNYTTSRNEYANLQKIKPVQYWTQVRKWCKSIKKTELNTNFRQPLKDDHKPTNPSEKNIKNDKQTLSYDIRKSGSCKQNKPQRLSIVKWQPRTYNQNKTRWTALATASDSQHRQATPRSASLGLVCPLCWTRLPSSSLSSSLSTSSSSSSSLSSPSEGRGVEAREEGGEEGADTGFWTLPNEICGSEQENQLINSTMLAWFMSLCITKQPSLFMIQLSKELLLNSIIQIYMRSINDNKRCTVI